MIGKVNAQYFGFCVMLGYVKTGPDEWTKLAVQVKIRATIKFLLIKKRALEEM